MTVAAMFDPARLTLARQVAGWSKKELAETIGRTPAVVTQDEAGLARPSGSYWRSPPRTGSPPRTSPPVAAHRPDSGDIGHERDTDAVAAEPLTLAADIAAVGDFTVLRRGYGNAVTGGSQGALGNAPRGDITELDECHRRVRRADTAGPEL